MNQKVSVKLSRDLNLFSVTMIGVGAMIGAGIFVLTGIASGVAGPAILLAFLLNGVVALFTASAYAELGGSLPEAGGGYLWVKDSLPQPTGFLAGWMSWMAHAVACSLYAIGFGAYFLEVLHELHIPYFIDPAHFQKMMATLIVIIFAYINFRGAKETGKAGNIITMLKIFILFLFIILGLKIIFINEPQRFAHFKPFFPKGFLGILTAMGLTYIAFEGYEIIAQSGEEVKNPEKNIPRAIFISLIIVVPIYIFVAFVALGVVNPQGLTAWAFLAEKKEIAMVEAARNINSWGGTILLIGGLLSTISALNATIYSSSRVSFAMGRDHNLPEIFSHVNSKHKTPGQSIFISSILIIIILLILPIEDVASGADVMFLFLFIFVNIALIHIRKKNPRILKGYKSPFFPLVPILGIITQSVLIIVMFIYSPKALYVSMLWIGAGLSIYYGYSRLYEKDVVGPKVLVEEKELAHRDFKLVVGIERKNELLPLMNVAIPLVQANGGEMFVTHVIPLPPQTPLKVGKHFIDSKKEILLQADDLGEKNKIPVSYNIRVSHEIYQGILDSVIENKGNILILGCGEVRTRGKILGSILDPLIQESPCDVGILKISKKKEVKKIKKILIPTAGGPNAKLAFTWGTWIAEQNKGKLTLLYIIRDEKERDKALHWLEHTKKDVPFNPKRVQDKILVGTNVSSIILEESMSYDLVLAGASREGIWKRLRFGTLPEKLTRKSDVSILVVRKYEGKILNWLRRFIAG